MNQNEHEDNGFIADNPDSIEYFQLSAAKAAIKLESVGLKHSSGKCVRKMWALHFGLSARAKHDEVTSCIKQRMEFLLTAKQGGVTAEQLQALCEYADKYKDGWKERLNASWCNGGDHGPLLQQVRNQCGPVWLSKIEIGEYK